MKILSIDTASNICGISVLEDKKLICNLDTDTGRTHSENLMPLIQEAFEKSKLQLNDMDLIACDVGPGSFTGIRIGVSTVKAFHDTLDIPCIGVSSLEALAYNVKDTINESACICSMIDCKNDNCYFALYEKKNGVLESLIEPQAESLEGALAILENYYNDSLDNVSLYFVGDGSIVYQTQIKVAFSDANFASDELNNLSSYSLGLAGVDKYYSGESLENRELLPLYLKKPQAERELDVKMS